MRFYVFFILLWISMLFIKWMNKRFLTFELQDQMNLYPKHLYKLYYTQCWPFGTSFESKDRRGKRYMYLQCI